MSRFATVNLLDVEDSAGGRDPGIEAHFGRKYLDSRDLGISYFRYPANVRSPRGHSHREQEEAYVVVAGSGRVLLDDEVLELHQWDVVRVAPEVVRAFEAAGVAGVFISDQVFPNRCGYLPGKQVIPVEQMLAKIKAALDALVN